MSPDPTANEIAKITGRPYNEARIALRILENLGGWTTHDARAFLIRTRGENLETMARASLAGSGGALGAYAL